MSAAKYIGLYTGLFIYLFSLQFLFLSLTRPVPHFSLYLFIFLSLSRASFVPLSSSFPFCIFVSFFLVPP